MARISTYARDTYIIGDDRWIGSSWDTPEKSTKNFTANAVADYFNRSAIIDTGQFSWQFQPYSDTQPQAQMTFQQIDHLDQNINILSLESAPLRVSALTMANTMPQIFIVNEWVDQSILVHVPSGPSQYAIYNVVSVVPDTEWFFIMELELVSGVSATIQQGDSLVFGYYNAANAVTEINATFPILVEGTTEPTISLDVTTKNNWNTAYSRSLVSASVTGTTTKTLTLTEQGGGTITTSWVDDNTDAVTSVFGRTGAVIAQSGDYTTTLVTEGTNLYFTDQRARNVISSSITGIEYANTTGIFSLTTGYFIPTMTQSATWDTAYNRSITSAAVTGTTTKTLTLNQQDGGTVTASWTDDNTNIITSVFGRTGAVVAESGDYTTTQVTEGTNLYFTDSRARTAISLTTTGTSGAATYDSATGILNVPQYQGGVTSFNTRTGAITLSSTDVTDALTFTPENVANKSNDTALGTSATLYPTQNAVKVYVDSATAGGIILQGDWDAATNTPNITATTQTGFAWRVSVAGNTDLGGITDWLVNDLAVKSATGWIKIDNTESVTSVFGRYGTVVAQSGDYNTDLVTEGTTNLYFTTARARASISAGTGISYDSATGVISSSGGSVTSVGLSMPTAFTVTNSPVTGAGTLTVTGAGTTDQYIRGDGTLATLPVVTGYVPYTGATANVDLGTFDLTADVITGATGSFTSSGSANTLSINHSSGSGIALNITKAGNDEGLYINKTSGSGNAATIVGTLQATTIVKSGGTSSQFLKADGSVDSTAYGTVTSVGLTLGTSGTDANISNSPITSTGEITLNLPTASATNRGLLSNGDWTTFNSKQTVLDGTGFVKATGTTISYDNTTYTPTSRTLTINGTTYDLSADRSWTVGASTSARTEQVFTATAGQQVFTVTGGYVVGLIDVYVNGVKLIPSTDFTAGDGTTVTLTTGVVLADIVSIVTYTANITVPSVSGSGTTNTIAKFVGSTAIGDSAITDDGTTVTLVSRALSGTSATFSSSVTSSDAFISTDGTNTIRLQKAYFGGIDAIYQTGTNAFGIYLGGGVYTAAKLYITNGGNVGIGTTAPTNGKLEVQQSATTAALWVQTGGTSSSHVVADFRTGTNLSALQILGNGVSSFSGNVGIGTTSFTASDFFSSVPLQVNSISGNIALRLHRPDATSGSGVGGLTFAGNDGSGNQKDIALIGGETSTTNAGGGALRFLTRTDGGSLAERMRITSGGKLAIGMTNADYGVVSIKSNSSTSYFGLNVYANSNDRFIALNHTGSEGVIETENAGSGIFTDMMFKTGASERMRIYSDGRIRTTVNGVNGQFQIHQTNSGYNSDAMMYLFNNRNATSSYNFAKFFSGYPDNTQDVEFVFRGDGVGFSDGGWTSPASDYAEYFESSNGQSLPIGSTVVLEDGKIRLATESDTNIIGVIRPKNAALFLGNNANTKWNQKYLKDDFGAYILDEEGMRILNPAYDSSYEYIPREKRNEWNIVGLVGQVPILKSQPVGSSWVKMYDVSSTVEMWLIK